MSDQLPPPSGDSEKADKYIHILIDLITQDKLLASHTDLSRFDPTSLQDHYRLDLENYEIEVSHNKQPNTGTDSFVILFNNLKHIDGQSEAKTILAYLYLSDIQFNKFKTVCDDQILRKKKEAEEKRFNEAISPIDQALNQLTDTTTAGQTIDNEIKTQPDGLSNAVESATEVLTSAYAAS